MKRNKQQKGATLVEFAIILPLLILLLFAIIEFSLLMYNQAMVTNSAREGARYGVVWAPVLDDPNNSGNKISYRVTQSAIEQHARDWLGNNLISFGDHQLNITVTADDPQDQCEGMHTDQILQVRVTYDYAFLFVPVGTITLSSEANMKCESTRPPDPD